MPPAVPTEPDARVRLPQHVVHRSFAAETVVLNLQTGHYHGLNHSAGLMLEALERCGSVHAAAHEVAAAFEQPLEQIERDLRTFCARLTERGLLEVDDGER
ncbi:MAG TPA: PqqD family protein [Conexibacter sp.]|nr:PqqD family protein [Conexibacter sp.]